MKILEADREKSIVFSWKANDRLTVKAKGETPSETTTMLIGVLLNGL